MFHSLYLLTSATSHSDLEEVMLRWFCLQVKMLRLHGSYQLDQLSNREVCQNFSVAYLLQKKPKYDA